MTEVLQLKELGNTAFRNGKYEQAVEYFTKAIVSSDYKDHVLFSNRSGSYAALKQWEAALSDADECLKLNPQFVKGYSRRGIALYNLGRKDDAIEAYNSGLKLDPNNENLRKDLSEINHDMADGFLTGDMIRNAVLGNAKLRGYANQDPTYISRLIDITSQIKTNPQVIASILGPGADSRLREGLFTIMGIGDMQFPNENIPDNHNTDHMERSKPEWDSTTNKNSTNKPDNDKGEGPENELRLKGNALYKARKFDEALEAYDRAIEIAPKNSMLYNNKAAVYMEMNQLEKAEEMCKKVLEILESTPDEYTKKAKAYARLGAIRAKMGDLNGAQNYYELSLVEESTLPARRAMQDIKKQIQQKEAEAYINPEKAEEHKAKGNEFFKLGDYPNAKKEYDEAIKRQPNSAILYANRAATYMKLLELPSAQKDIEKALEIDPNYSKAWSRKGNIHLLAKEYNKALVAYDKGLQLDPNSQECQQGKAQCIMKIQQGQASGQVDEEQVKRAMQDPEIQAILSDPQFQQILRRITESPNTLSEYMQDAKIVEALGKLSAAGILRCA